MLQMLGIVLVIGSCTALGLSARQRLVRRVRALTQFLRAFDLILTEMRANQTPLPQLIDRLCGEELGEVRRFFVSLQKRMQRQSEFSFSHHWQAAARDLAEPLGLGREEVEALRHAALYLGRYQAEQQIDGLQYTRAQLEGICKEARQALQTKGNLYRTCGIAAGVALVLMML